MCHQFLLSEFQSVEIRKFLGIRRAFIYSGV